MKRRLEIARGLLHSPRVLFLDEPTVGLDPQTRSHIWSYIHELRQREATTIFLTTHYMDEAEHCDRIAIMDQGLVSIIDSPAALKARVGQDRVQIDTDDDDAAVARLAERFDLAATVREGRSPCTCPTACPSCPACSPTWESASARSRWPGPPSTTCS